MHEMKDVEHWSGAMIDKWSVWQHTMTQPATLKTYVGYCKSLYFRNTYILVVWGFKAETANIKKVYSIQLNYENYLSITNSAFFHGREICKLLPFVHSISGRDLTNFTIRIGKPSWFNQCQKSMMHYLAGLGEDAFDVTMEWSKQKCFCNKYFIPLKRPT